MTWEEAALADNYNRSVGRWADAYYDMEAHVHALQRQLAESRQSVDRLASRLAQTNAHAQGLGNQVQALKEALYKAVPTHHLLHCNQSGKTWPGGAFKGQVVSNIGLEYIRGFEATLVKMGADAKDFPDWYL